VSHGLTSHRADAHYPIMSRNVRQPRRTAIAAEASGILDCYSHYLLRLTFRCLELKFSFGAVTQALRARGLQTIKFGGPSENQTPIFAVQGRRNLIIPTAQKWCPRRESNPQNFASKANTYTNSVTWALQLAEGPGLEPGLFGSKPKDLPLIYPSKNMAWAIFREHPHY
jgi:hypothetical protein